MVCRRFRNQRDDECHDELGELRRFTKRRNCSTLRGHQSDNLSFKEDGMTRRSIPSSFHANLFALVPARCPSSTCGVAMVVIEAALGDVPFLPAVGDTPCINAVSNARENATRFFGRIPGRGFRMGRVAETATRNIAPQRDAVSPMGLKRKARPIPELQNGMRFPRGRIVAAALSGVARYSPKISSASSSCVSTT